MAEHRCERLAGGGAPERHHAVRVAHVGHGVLRVVREHLGQAVARGVAGHVLAYAHVVPLDPAGVPHRREQEVVGQVVQSEGVLVALHAVHLHALVVVYVGVLGLGDGEHGLVVQILHRVHVLAKLQLRAHRRAQTVEHRHVALLSAEEHEASVATVARLVRPEPKLEVEVILLRVQIDHAPVDHVLLRQPVGLLVAARLHLDAAAGGRQQHPRGLVRLGALRLRATRLLQRLAQVLEGLSPLGAALAFHASNKLCALIGSWLRVLASLLEWVVANLPPHLTTDPLVRTYCHQYKA